MDGGIVECGANRAVWLPYVEVDLRFERRCERAGDPRPEDDQVPDLDRVQELQAVDGGSYEETACVAMTGNRSPSGSSWRPIIPRGRSPGSNTAMHSARARR